MKLKFTVIVLLVAGLLLSAFSCHKNKGAITGGGKGGNATLVVEPYHLGLDVDSCTIYIKYATLDAPANNIYDDSQIVNSADTLAFFPHLTTGNYYIFANGYHAKYFEYVKGGIGIIIDAQDTNHELLPVAPYFP